MNLITHPRPRRASDFYTRLEMQWPGMCAAVLAIDPAAWAGAPTPVTSAEVTTRVTGKGTANEKPPTSVENVGGEMEREKGFEQRLLVNSNLATAHVFQSLLPVPPAFQHDGGLPAFPQGSPPLPLILGDIRETLREGAGASASQCAVTVC